ncbi:hypothetical protein [Isoalcanivorax indicus]|uniref:hypothetical protein n=1 Tax=Isoalcanivorax indicus TaxID=2202653 RepID=UPI000DBAB566|nr:hypothetical protein [Isoalcanivorax indicus]
MRRYLAALFLLSLMLSARAELHPALSSALCSAAAEDSALAPQMEALLEAELIGYHQVEAVLNLPCGDQTLLATVVNGQLAENLEYLAIDLDLDLNAPVVEYAGRRVSFEAFLRARGARGDDTLKTFVETWLADLGDASFNPNLELSMN